MRKSYIPEIDINDHELLQEWYFRMYPGGSGPLGEMRIICALIEAIAREKGFELEKPNRGLSREVT